MYTSFVEVGKIGTIDYENHTKCATILFVNMSGKLYFGYRLSDK